MSVYYSIIEGIYIRFSMGDMIQGVMPMGAFHSLMRKPRLQGKIFLENGTFRAEKCTRKDGSGLKDHVQDTLARWKGSGFCQSSSVLT